MHVFWVLFQALDTPIGLALKLQSPLRRTVMTSASNWRQVCRTVQWYNLYTDSQGEQLQHACHEPVCLVPE